MQQLLLWTFMYSCYSILREREELKDIRAFRRLRETVFRATLLLEMSQQQEEHCSSYPLSFEERDLNLTKIVVLGYCQFLR